MKSPFSVRGFVENSERKAWLTIGADNPHVGDSKHAFVGVNLFMSLDEAEALARDIIREVQAARGVRGEVAA